MRFLRKNCGPKLRDLPMKSTTPVMFSHLGHAGHSAPFGRLRFPRVPRFLFLVLINKTVIWWFIQRTVRKEANHRVRKERTREHVRERRARRVSRFGGCVLKYEHNSLFPIQKHGQTLTCPDIANGDLSPVFCTNGQASKCDFYVKIAEKFTIFNVKIADQNLERGFGTERWHGETRRGRSAPGGASLAAVPVLGSSFYASIHVHILFSI